MMGTLAVSGATHTEDLGPESILDAAQRRPTEAMRVALVFPLAEWGGLLCQIGASLALGRTRQHAPTSLQASSRILTGRRYLAAVTDQTKRLVLPDKRTPCAIRPRVANDDESSIDSRLILHERDMTLPRCSGHPSRTPNVSLLNAAPLLARWTEASRTTSRNPS